MAHGTPSENDSAMTMLLKIAAVTPDLAQDDQQKILQTVSDALHDSDPGTRMSAVMASGSLGPSKLVPIIKELASSDPYKGPSGGGRFWIREEAKKAIEAIQRRANNQ
jgi:hypothetical protein